MITVTKHLIVDPPETMPNPSTGWSHRFNASLTDISTIRLIPWTTVIILDPEDNVLADPWVWRMDAVSDDVIVELECVSDAGTRSMREEAVESWRAITGKIHEAIRYFHLLGLHRHVLRRLEEPCVIRPVEIRTLQDDLPERMAATGSIEIGRLCEALRLEQDREMIPVRIRLEEFLWPRSRSTMTEQENARYARHLTGNFPEARSSYDRPTQMMPR